MKQKLADLSRSFRDEMGTKEIWSNIGQDLPKPSNITMHFDTVKNVVALFSDDVDGKGRPLLQWEMEVDTGHVMETKRLNNEVVITHRDFDPKMFDQDQDDQMMEVEDEELASVRVSEDWNDLDTQRGFAYNIMYFFVFFFIFTFSLLFAFFRLTQKQQEKEEALRKRGGKGGSNLRHLDNEQQIGRFDNIGENDDTNLAFK